MPFSKDFNAVCYLANYPDLQDHSTMKAQPNLPITEQFGWMFKSGAKATKGQWLYGRTDGRELKRIQDDPYWHWVNFGSKEGRIPGCNLGNGIFSPNFDADAYMARYPDVRGVSYAGDKNPYIGRPLEHYLAIGKKQGRIPGYELLLSTNLEGVYTPGTVKFATLPEIQADQAEFERQNQSPGQGATATGSGGIQTSAMSDQNKKLYLIGGIAAVGAGIYFFNRRKKGR